MAESLKITILGSGSSGGVPRVGGDWGICDPNEPKNRRMRCSLLVEYWQGASMPPPKDRTSVLIDTSPDLREQCLTADIKRLDAVLYTHDHADQSHGIDDLRALAYRMQTRIPTYMDAPTRNNLFSRFKYCFEMPDGRVHPPILNLMPDITIGNAFTINGPGGDLPISVIGLEHGPTPSLGFVFDDKAIYTPDANGVSEATLEQIANKPLWIVDALRYNSHPTHAHADRTLQWVARARTKKAVLTNLHIDMDYQTLSAELPGPHLAAYDGMTFTL